MDERKQLKHQIKKNSKTKLLKENLRCKYSSKDREVKSSMKSDKIKWSEGISDVKQKRYLVMDTLKTVYEITRVLGNERKATTATVKD